MTNRISGQSVIEIIVAMAIFVIIAASAVIAILGSFSSTRLGMEETAATLISTEGVEAAQSIRNQDWINLTDGDHGLTKVSGVWQFSGTSDTDPSGKYTRVVTIEGAQRDSGGELVSSGGTVDDDTKKITVTTSWDFTPARSNSAEITTYLTNWQSGRSQAGSGGAVLFTCAEYCSSVGYSAGTCRQNQIQCGNNSEEYKPAGSQYCTGGASADTCCCTP